MSIIPYDFEIFFRGFQKWLGKYFLGGVTENTYFVENDRKIKYLKYIIINDCRAAATNIIKNFQAMQI